jgi:hypothetical protein
MCFVECLLAEFSNFFLMINAYCYLQKLFDIDDFLVVTLLRVIA